MKITLQNKKRGIGCFALAFLLLLSLAFGVAATKRAETVSAAEVAETKTATVSGVTYGLGNQNLLAFSLTGTDYPTVNGGDATTFNVEISYERLSSLDFFDKVTINGVTLATIYEKVDGNDYPYYVNLFQVSNRFALHLPGYSKDSDIREIVVAKGCQFPAYDEENGCYTVASDTKFVKENEVWKQKIDFETSEVSVTGISYGAYGVDYLIFTLDGTDYPPNGADAALQNYKIDESVLASMNFFDKIFLDGKTLGQIFAENKNYTYRDYVLNLFQYHGTLGFPLPINGFKEVVIEAGCQFPSYEYVKNGGDPLCFETSAKIIAVKGTDTSFVMFEECNDRKPAVLDDSVTLTYTDEGCYGFDIRFNRTGAEPADEYVEDELAELVAINGVTLAEINEEEKYARAKWKYIGGRYYLSVTLSENYEGDAEIVNEDDYFVGNSVRLSKEILLPSGEKLGNCFILHVYRTNCVTEIVDEDLQEEKTFVENISAGYDVNGDFNIWITFSEEISAGMRLFLASPDSFGREQLKPMNNTSIVYYDDALSENFISGGYKSALLDNVLINGVSIGEWLAYDQTPGYLTAVMAHYGQVNQKTMSIVCDLADDGSWATDVFNSATEAYKNGSLRVTVKAGMRFPTGKRTTEDAEYLFVDGVWRKKTSEFRVYYAGQAVEDEQRLVTQTKADKNNIFIQGNATYTIEETRNENEVSFTILADGKYAHSFTVTEDIKNAPDGNGCTSALGSTTATLLLVVTAIWFGKRRKNNA